MESEYKASELPAVAREEYEIPELEVIGNAADVVMALPGGGGDGPYGMSEPQFEFEQDDEQR